MELGKEAPGKVSPPHALRVGLYPRSALSHKVVVPINGFTKSVRRGAFFCARPVEATVNRNIIPQIYTGLVTVFFPVK